MRSTMARSGGSPAFSVAISCCDLEREEHGLDRAVEEQQRAVTAHLQDVAVVARARPREAPAAAP